MNTKKIIYWVSTAVMCLIFTFSAGMYALNYDTVIEVFPKLGFPSWIVIPLAIAKILGVVAILTNKSKVLSEWAYAGFFFDAVLAFSAHYIAEDGQGMVAMIAIIAALVSRFYWNSRHN